MGWLPKVGLGNQSRAKLVTNSFAHLKWASGPYVGFMVDY
ncbi:unnamed protein product [Acidithrix sp. C25]|nr:unnamed protein product [Acidithrix sp. C25]